MFSLLRLHQDPLSLPLALPPPKPPVISLIHLHSRARNINASAYKYNISYFLLHGSKTRRKICLSLVCESELIPFFL